MWVVLGMTLRTAGQPIGTKDDEDTEEDIEDTEDKQDTVDKEDTYQMYPP